MTVRTRNLIYWTIFIWILFAGTAMVILAVGALLPDLIPVERVLSPIVGSTPASRISGLELIELTFTGEGAVNRFRVMITAGGSLLVSAILSGMFLRFFRRITASHLFFLYLFLLSVSGELIKGLNLLLSHFGSYESLLLITSRLSLMIYLGGLFSGFTIGLYLLGIKYQHQGTALILIVVLSAAVAFALPMDTSSLNENYLYQTFFLRELMWSVGAILLITLFGYASHLLERFSKQELVRVIFAALFLCGHAVLYFSVRSLGGLVGGSLVVTGLVFYYLRLFYDYFWY